MSDTHRIIRGPFATETLEIDDKSFAQILWTSLDDNGPKLALVEVETGVRVTYDQLKVRSTLVARRLLAQGCRRGDVIAIFSPNSIAWIVVYLAASRIGAVPAGINALLTLDELRHQLRVCKARFAFTTQALAKDVLVTVNELATQTVFVSGSDHPGCVDIEAAPRADDEQQLPSLPTFESLDMKLDDPAVIYFSSGTTGVQKGLLLSNRNMHAERLLILHPRCAVISSRILSVFAPFSHLAGSLLFSVGLTAGCTIHFMSRFDPDAFLHILEQEKIESVLVVPPVATMMVKNPELQKFRLESLRDLVVATGGLSAEVEDLLLEKYPKLTVRHIYGLSETTGFISVTSFEKDGKTFIRRPGSTGVPCPGTLMKVIDTKTGEALGPRENGEVCIKSPNLMLGYVNNPQATADIIDKDGWLHSGDIGYYDEDGYLYIIDRLKELIKYNSYQVAPAELEAVLLSHPEVADAGVVGLPDPSAGELPLAWVVRKQNATVTELQLQQFVEAKVAPFKKLRGGVQFVTAIPRNGTGKILRREMKAALLR